MNSSITTQLLRIPRAVWVFWKVLSTYMVGATKYSQIDEKKTFASLFQCPMEGTEKDETIPNQCLRARVHCFVIALNYLMFSKPHYRHGTHQKDMLLNLRNLAIPGTGIPMSLYCFHRYIFVAFVFAFVPLIAFVVSIYWLIFENKEGKTFDQIFVHQLFLPEDWFTYWRMNSVLASYHSLVAQAKGYTMENKATFLKYADENNVPVSKFCGAQCEENKVDVDKDITEWVIKDKNEEGGMGIHFFHKENCKWKWKNHLDLEITKSGKGIEMFQNAFGPNNGKWIIQPRIHNSTTITHLLPQNAPLSTFRVITGSEHYCGNKKVTAMSCVFRAGRENASTDHTSLLFDINMKTGKFRHGTTNDHWGKIGFQNALRCQWMSSHSIRGINDNECIQNYGTSLPVLLTLGLLTFSAFGVLSLKSALLFLLSCYAFQKITSPNTSSKTTNFRQVEGKSVPKLREMLDLCSKAHDTILPDVPLAGWDVAIYDNNDGEPEICLLEVNLSCNFFRGSFDRKQYFCFMDSYLTQLEKEQNNPFQ